MRYIGDMEDFGRKSVLSGLVLSNTTLPLPFVYEPFHRKRPKSKSANVILRKAEKQIEPYESTAKEVSFEW